MAILTVPSDEALEAFAHAYELGPLRASHGIEAGTVNTSYALELGNARYFLRLYEEQGMEGAASEADLLRHLARAGVPTPAPIAGRDGAFVRTLVGKPAALFPWVDGGMLCQRSVTPGAARDVGVALARMHRAGPATNGTLGEGRFGPRELVARCDRVARSKDAEAAGQADGLRAAVVAVASERAPDLPGGLVHGDLFRDNVLWHDGKISALLDFESAHLGPFAYDIAVTILSWSFRDELDLAVARAVVDGYREVREIEPDERSGLYAEAKLAALRFTITRITDDAIRVGKRWQRFVARRLVIENLGKRGLCDALGL